MTRHALPGGLHIDHALTSAAPGQCPVTDCEQVPAHSSGPRCLPCHCTRPCVLRSSYARQAVHSKALNSLGRICPPPHRYGGAAEGWSEGCAVCWALLAQLKQTGAARVCRRARQPLATRLRACGNAGRPWAAHRAAGEHEAAVQAQHEEVPPVGVHAIHDRGVPAQVHAPDPVHEHKVLLRQHARGGRLREEPARARRARPAGALRCERGPPPAPACAHTCTGAGLCAEAKAEPRLGQQVSSAVLCSAATTGCLAERIPRAHSLGRHSWRQWPHLGMSSRSVRTARPKLTWNSLSLGGPGPMPPPKGVMPQVCSCSSRSSPWLAGAARLAAPRGRGVQCRAGAAPNGLQAGSRGTGAAVSAGRGGATPALASMAAASGIVALFKPSVRSYSLQRLLC